MISKADLAALEAVTLALRKIERRDSDKGGTVETVKNLALQYGKGQDVSCKMIERVLTTPLIDILAAAPSQEKRT